MAKQTEEVAIDIVVNEDGEIQKIDQTAKSVDNLTDANKALIKERGKLDVTTKVGRENAAKLTKAIDENKESIANNTKSGMSWKQGLTSLVPGLEGAITGIGGMTKAAWAFVANPIGAVIAALGLALVAIISYFKSSEAGGDKLAKAWAALSAVIGVMYDRLVMVGDALVSLLSGDVDEGLDKLSKSFEGVGDEIEREVALALELADALDALEERELKHGVAVSETANEIKRLLIAAKDRTKTEEEGVALRKKALDLEKKQQEELNQIQLDKLLISAKQLQMDFSQHAAAKEAGEDAIAFAKRLIANEDIVLDRRQEVADLLIAYNQAQGESLNLQEKILNQISAAEEKAEEARAKAREQKAKDDKEAKEAAAIAELEKTDLLIRQRDQEFAFEIEINDFKKQAKENLNEALDAAEKKRLKQAALNAKEEERIEKFKTTALLTMNNMLFREKSVARIAFNAILKKDALTQMAIDTKAGAVAAYKALAGIYAVGPVLGALAAAAVVAYGLTSMASVAGIQFFARGGEVNKRGTFSGNRHSRGGEKYVNTRTGHRIEVEDGENFYVLNRAASAEINALSAVNVKNGGRGFGSSTSKHLADGGQVYSRPLSVQQSLTIDDVEAISSAVARNIRIVADIADIRTAADNQISIEDTARVLS